MQVIKFFVLLVLAFTAPGVYADAQSLKVDVVTYSENKEIRVVSNVRGKTTVLNRSSKTLWQIKKYVRYAYVSNDGQYLAAMYGGGNLVPFNYDPDLILVALYRNGRLIKEIKIKDVVSSRSEMEVTTSHFDWGDAVGFVDLNNFELKRRDGKVFRYNLKGL